MHKRKLDISGYKYNSHGVCDNPTTFLQFSSSTFYYELLVSECHAGWLIGWTYGNKKGAGSSCWPHIKNGIHPTRTGAEIEVAEKCAKYFSEDIRSSAFAALKEFLEQSGSTFLSDQESKEQPINKNNMAKEKKQPADKVPAEEKPASKKKTRIITTPMGIGKNRDKGDANILGSVNSGPGDIVFVSVKLVDGFCNYQYILKGGKADGFKHVVDGKGIITDDFRNAFQLLNVHLAIIDDVFKHNSIDITNLNVMHAHELTYDYHVTGFKISGGEENPNVVLLGNKYLSSSDRMELTSPKKSLDATSSYKWFAELAAALESCKEEALLYHDGNYTLPDKKEKKEKKGKDKTGNLFAQQEQQDADHDGEDFNEDDQD